MRFSTRFLCNSLLIAPLLMLPGCFHRGANPADPLEPLNREVYKFNAALDATFLRPPARFYRAVVPRPIRVGVGNAFNNILTIPTVANDIVQGDINSTMKDTWRFLINSTFGIAGFFDIADSHFKIPPHENDFGLTLAHWGSKNSTYVVIPVIGPSTVRDGFGRLVDCMTFGSPLGYFFSDILIMGASAVRYVDLRAQYFESEDVLHQSLDQYTFVRGAYLQHRRFLITGEQENVESIYVDETTETSPKKTK
ncbi:MAG: VacJ family lipoprotein [Legionella sp.]|nr:VacJ family lipoprotein [Legionella sp.]